MKPEFAAFHLILALLAVFRRIADRGLEAPHSDLAVAATGDDATTEGGSCDTEEDKEEPWVLSRPRATNRQIESR